VNIPINWSDKYKSLNEREKKILVVGYFSEVKNQKFALKLMEKIRGDISLCFIGAKKGAYYDSCKLISKEPLLDGRITFLEDHECDLANEIASCMLLLSPSTTEVLPLTLLEAMASGTPFVASSVGAVPGLRGGLNLRHDEDWLGTIESFFYDSRKWKFYSEEGRKYINNNYTIDKLSKQLEDGISEVFKNQKND
jgi:glycosyltransferase involved in cell wall biosynthesis